MGGNITSAAEENILGIPGTRYFGEHILVHEFSHNIMGALRVADPALVKEVEAAYDAAKEKNLYRGAVRDQHRRRVLGGGHAVVVLVEHRVLRPHDEGARADARRVQGVRSDAVRDSRARLPGHHIPADIYYGKNLRPVRSR